MIPCENMYLVVKPYGVMGPPEFELLFNGNVVFGATPTYGQWRYSVCSVASPFLWTGYKTDLGPGKISNRKYQFKNSNFKTFVDKKPKMNARATKILKKYKKIQRRTRMRCRKQSKVEIIQNQHESEQLMARNLIQMISMLEKRCRSAGLEQEMNAAREDLKHRISTR